MQAYRLVFQGAISFPPTLNFMLYKYIFFILYIMSFSVNQLIATSIPTGEWSKPLQNMFTNYHQYNNNVYIFLNRKVNHSE